MDNIEFKQESNNYVSVDYKEPEVSLEKINLDDSDGEPEQLELKREPTISVRVDTPRPAPIDEDDEDYGLIRKVDDSHYILFNKLLQSFFDNFHDDTVKDEAALKDIILATNQLIYDKNDQAIKFKEYCNQFIIILTAVKSHPALD